MYVCTCVYVCMCVLLFIHTPPPTRTCVYTHTHTHTYLCVFIHTHTNTYLCLYTRTCVHTHTYLCSYTHVLVFIHTRTHTWESEPPTNQISPCRTNAVASFRACGKLGTAGVLLQESRAGSHSSTDERTLFSFVLPPNRYTYVGFRV
jgi:hypothetical protein